MQEKNDFSNCKVWAETILNIITNTFSYYSYLKGLSELYCNEVQITIQCKNFIEHIKYLLQSSICLNINKLFIDSGKDVYSFKNYKKLLDNYYGENLKVSSPKISTNLKNAILNFRKKYIAHSIADSESIQIEMNDLYELLVLASEYFNDITSTDLIEYSRRLTSESISNFIKFRKSGLFDFILSAK